MNTTLNDQTIKKLIKQELPGLMKKDRKIREWILLLTKEQLTEKANEIETKTGSKFDRLLEELKRDREEQTRKWEEQKEESNRDREEQTRKWEEQKEESNRDREEQARKWEELKEESNRDREEQARKWEELKEESKRDREEQARKWEELKNELNRDREEQARKWEEQKEESKRDREEQARKWEENQKEIRKLYDVIEKNREESSQKLNNAFSALGARWGLRTESSFRNGLKGILEDLGLAVEHIDIYDKEGMVYGWPSSVEIDVIIKNGLLMICELKSSMSKADMFIFYKKALFYEKKYQRKGDRLIVISPMVNDKARKVAVDLGIKVYSYAEDLGKDL
jgi:hypothetical protein